MSSLNVAVYTSRSSLLTNQKRMDVTANNLANVDKPGYHRQLANLQHNNPIDTVYGQFGTGVHVAQIVRSYDQALETSLQQSVSNEGNTGVYADQLYYMEGVVSPSGDASLASAVRDFTDSLQHVASRPEATDARLDLLATTEGMATQFNTIHGEAIDLRDNIANSANEGTLSDKITELNGLLTQVDEVNGQIVKSEARLFNPTEANDLRDYRDQLVVDIAKLTDVTTSEEANHAFTLTIGGQTAVDGTALTNDSLSLDMSSGSPVMSWANGGAPAVATISDGEINGLTRAFSYFDTKAADLWTYATNLGTAINTQHAAGFDANGTGGGALIDFGTPGAMTVQITDPDKIAAADLATNSGSGTNLSTMWDNLNNGGLITEAEDFANTIAREVKSSAGSADTGKATKSMFQEAVDAVSAVSIDEEMIDMLDLQRGFQASSRVISAVDDMLGAALNMI